MSVPEGLRGKSEFGVSVKANALASYTMKICINPNVFDPAYNDVITREIVTLAKDIFIAVYTANRINAVVTRGEEKLVNQEKLDTRRKLQKRALQDCSDLLALIQMAGMHFHLSSKRIAHWGGMVVEVESMISSWMESDRHIFNKIKHGT